MDPARSVALEITHQGSQGKIELTFEEWQGTRIDIAFRDRLYRNSGMIQFDGRNRRSIITTSRPYEGPLADAAAVVVGRSVEVALSAREHDVAIPESACGVQQHRRIQPAMDVMGFQ
jgi:hypothetical protein